MSVGGCQDDEVCCGGSYDCTGCPAMFFLSEGLVLVGVHFLVGLKYEMGHHVIVMDDVLVVDVYVPFNFAPRG